MFTRRASLSALAVCALLAALSLSPGTAAAQEAGGHAAPSAGAAQPVDARGEYPSIYDRFAALVAASQSEVDREPLRIVADAFLVGRREMTEPFL